MASNITAVSEGTFIEMLKNIQQGDVIFDVEDALVQVVNGATETGGKGSVSLTLTLEPDPKTGTMRVSADVKAKIPKKPSRVSLFFVTPSGQLSRQDPRQREMFSD